MNVITKVHHVWSHGLMTATVLRWLSRLGITIVPYYLFEESDDFLKTLPHVKPILDQPFEKLILDRGNSDLLRGFECLPEVENEFEKLWDRGCTCVCLVSGDSILAYGWFDLTRCNYEHLSFELKNNEAYIFGFRTAKNMRGRNLALFLGTILYPHLQSLGRNRFYSITEKFNTPAMRIKEKRDAKPRMYYIYVSLFGRAGKNIKIKTIGTACHDTEK
jgi:hypothetical protein